MKTKITALLLLCWCTTMVYGQAKTYSDQDLESFSKVLVQSGSEQQFIESETMKILKDTGMSYERYGAILRAQFDNTKANITPEEQEAIVALEGLKINYISIRENKLKKECELYNFDFNTFLDIKNEIKKDVQLKQRLQPIIESIAKKN